MRRSRRERRFCESRYLSWLKQFAASGECNELRRVAVRRLGWRRTARLCEPQKLGQQHKPNSPPKFHSKARPSAAGKPITVFPPEEQQAQPKAEPSSLPRISLTAAPLSLRRACRRPRQFLPDWPSANRQNMSFKRAGDGFLARSGFFACSSLFARLEKSCQNAQVHFDDFPP